MIKCIGIIQHIYIKKEFKKKNKKLLLNKANQKIKTRDRTKTKQNKTKPNNKIITTEHLYQGARILEELVTPIRTIPCKR